MDTTSIANSSNNPIFWGISSDTIFTTIITILIFFLGFGIKWIYEYFNERSRLKNLMNYYFSQLEYLMKQIEKQSSSFIKLSDDIISKEQKNFSYGIISDPSIKNILNISQVDLFKIFVNNNIKDKNKFTKYKNLMNSITFIEDLRLRTKSNFDNFFSDYRRYQKDFKRSTNSILRLFDSIRSFNEHHNIKVTDDKLLQKMDKVIYEWSIKDKSPNIYITKEFLLDPLKEIGKEMIDDPRSNVLLQIVIEGIDSFIDFDGIKKLYSGIFKEESEKLNEKKKQLVDSIEYFKAKLSK